MKDPMRRLDLLLALGCVFFCAGANSSPAQTNCSLPRRILHQPLIPIDPVPLPPDLPLLPPPPPPFEEPFFPESPGIPTTNPNAIQPPQASPANGSIPMPSATQPSKPAKKVAIAISVGLVTLGMLSVLAFFLYRHRKKHLPESQKLFGDGGADNSRRFDERLPSSSFLYIGTVEPSRSSVIESTTSNGSPYHKLNPGRKLERYRPSPELQPLPPLPKPPTQFEHKNNSPPAGSSSSSSDEETSGVTFYTPQASSVSNEDGYNAPNTAARTAISSGGMMKSANGTGHVAPSNVGTNVPHSKRTSPRSRFPPPLSPEMKYAIFPSSHKPSQVSPSSAPPSLTEDEVLEPYAPKRPKFAPPPPPPDVALLQAIGRQETAKSPPLPPPPPPPPLPLMSTLMSGKVVRSRKTGAAVPLVSQQKPWTSTRESDSRIVNPRPVEVLNRKARSLDNNDGDENDGGKLKLKPLHWDKVRATSDRATVWDQIKSNSFQLNEGMMESLFGFNSSNSAPKEPKKKFDLPPAENENRVLDPKKSQNIAILLRALNVTRDEVSEALLDGNPESLGVELLETLVKMAPTKEEETKLRNYQGDATKLGSAERFLYAILDIPFAFIRAEAMLYRANFNAEVKYLRGSFQTLQEASSELKNSRLFLKLLEAVLTAGNRMNVGTNRGDAKAFKLDTLLKLVDIKGTDGRTTLLHFVVKEIMRSEGLSSDSDRLNLESHNKSTSKEEDFSKQGLEVVSNLSKDLSDVKKAAGMDFDVLNSYVSKLESGLEKVRSVLQYEQPDMRGKFFQSMKTFLREADEEIIVVKLDERNALEFVKDVTQYFHGDAAKEEAHPLRIFMIVRDFLNVLDHVCKEVGILQDRAAVGSARSFRLSSTASLPVLSRYNVRKCISDEETFSP